MTAVPERTSGMNAVPAAARAETTPRSADVRRRWSGVVITSEAVAVLGVWCVLAIAITTPSWV
jgi:hypothetical protein